jgi:WD40 repeat protein
MALSSPVEASQREPMLRRACGQLRSRLLAGDERPAESLLAEFGELAGDSDAALELIYSEYVLREELGRQLPLDAWRERFPQWADAFQRLIEVHRELHRGEQLDTARGDATTPPAGQPAASGPAERLPETAPERYELLEEIGRGGMGVVYRARQAGLAREVALKLVLCGELADPALRQRFLHEAQTTARLIHPRIVQVFDVGLLAGQPYLAMEYLPGGTLADRLARGPLPPPVAARLVAALARAIDYAHAQGIVHRDLKPANVLLREPVTDLDDFKIADFGLAKAASRDGAGSPPTATGSAAVLGTPSYMAPEQAQRAAEIGPRTDVYALGAVLYETLVGRPPFRGDSPLETLQQVVALDPVPPARLQPKVPRELETICLACLAKEPARRYATAAALADDLERHLDGRPIAARPASFVSQGVKWCRRRPAVAILLATLLVGTVASLATITALWRSAVVALADKDAALAREALARQRAEGLLAEKLVALAELAWQNNDAAAARRHLAEVPPAHRGDRWRTLERACTAGRHVLTLESNVDALAISPDGTRIAASSAHGTLAVWELASGREICRALRAGRAGSFVSLSFTPDGRQIVRAAAFSSSPTTGRPDLFEWRTFDAASGQRTAMQTVRGPYSLVRASGGARHVAAWNTASSELCLWDAATGVAGQRVRCPFPATGLVFSPDESHVYVSATDGLVRRIDVAGGRIANEWTGGATGRSPLALDREEKRLAAALHGDLARIAVQIRDTADGRVLGQFPTSHAWVGDVALDPPGRRVATCGRDGTVVVWQVADGRELVTLRGHDGEAQVVAFSPDGKWLASGGRDHTVRIWNVDP